MVYIYYMAAYFTMRTYGVNQAFRFTLLKAFGYIEKVVKSVFFVGKDLFYIIHAQHVLSYHLV